MAHATRNMRELLLNRTLHHKRLQPLAWDQAFKEISYAV